MGLRPCQLGLKSREFLNLVFSGEYTVLEIVHVEIF